MSYIDSDEHPEFGQIRYTYEDGRVLYRRGNMCFLVKGNRVLNKCHVDDVRIMLGIDEQDSI